MSSDFELYYSTALELVKQSGKIVREKSAIRNKRIKAKASAIDLVTETDGEIEKLLIDNLSKKFPDHKFIGEESVANGEECQLTDAPTWIIDPIDGTMNFVHSCFYFSISVALFVNQQPEIGIVYNPVLDQLFTARRGKGAFLNGEPIKVSEKKPLSEALVITEIYGEKGSLRVKVEFENYKMFLEESHGIRTLGSAALDLCMVACGAADVVQEHGLAIWDIAAGELIVTEAGGVVVDTNGGPLDRFSQRLLVANSRELADTVAQKLVQYDASKERNWKATS